VTAAVMSRLRVPRPEEGSRDFSRLVELAQSLAASGVDDDNAAYAELNAIAAQNYSLSQDDYEHVLRSFPLISDQLKQLCLRAHVRTTEARRRGGS